jgi:hypothetical protein
VFRDEMKPPFTEQLIDLERQADPAARSSTTGWTASAWCCCSSPCCPAPSRTGAWCRSR